MISGGYFRTCLERAGATGVAERLARGQNRPPVIETLGRMAVDLAG
jgi:hypothetical protein